MARACYLAGLAGYEAQGERYRPARLLFVLYRASAPAHLVVDVSDVWNRRMDAVRAHASQFDPAAGDPTYLTAAGFLESVEGRARAWGALAGVAHAEGFRVRGAWPVDDARALLGAAGGGRG